MYRPERVPWRRGRGLCPAEHDHDTHRRAVGIRLELTQLGYEQDHLQQLVDTLALQRRHLDADGVAAPFLRNEAVVDELLLDPFRVGPRPVNLVDGHDDGHIGRFCVIDCLDRLGHHAIVGGHYEHGYVGHLSTTRAHRGKGLVPGRVEERDLLPV